MEYELPYSPNNEQQFWEELHEIVSAECESHAVIDNTLRAYLSFTARYKGVYANSIDDISHCSYKLLSSSLFSKHADYVRRQIIYGLLQDDDPDTLLIIVSFLLLDGRENKITFLVMNEEGSFPRLLELIEHHKPGDDARWSELHFLLLNLLYETSRIQRVKIEDLVLVEDDIVRHLFDFIEQPPDDTNDPYHYHVIRALLVLNEQFIVSADDPTSGTSHHPPTNKVIKILSVYGNVYKTFGENIILLLNREVETSLQMLTLKLLYLIFTTPSTYEYFYTNDLRVLVDILIRNLLDLPEEATPLRHTYLRVLYPLLAHTQLKYPPYYKRDEVKSMLSILVHGQFQENEDCERILHFADVDEDTKRLVARCWKVEWLRDRLQTPREDNPTDNSVPTDSSNKMTGDLTVEHSQISPVASLSPVESTSFKELTDFGSPSMVFVSSDKQVKVLGMSLEPARSSSVSMLEVASHTEKPGMMPIQQAVPIADNSMDTRTAVKVKQKPDPPKARRWRGREAKDEDDGGSKSATDEAEAKIENSVSRRRSSDDFLAPSPRLPTSRSVSRLRPAVPPPRRSSYATVACQSAPNAALGPGAANGHHKQSSKPEPPKTRRWRHGTRAKGEPAVHKQEEPPGRSAPPTSLMHQESSIDSSSSLEDATHNLSVH